MCSRKTGPRLWASGPQADWRKKPVRIDNTMTPSDIEEFKIMLAEAFRLGAAGRRPGSGCLDWFMSDAGGNIAVFTGGGLDLVPVDVFDDERTFVDAYLYFLKRGTTDGRSEDYREWEDHDLFVYDTAFSGRCEGTYRRVAVPDRPLNLENIEGRIVRHLKKLEINDIKFQDTSFINLTRYFTCI